MSVNRPAFSEYETSRVFEKTNGRCGYCGEFLTFKNRNHNQDGGWHIDHIKPLSEGGHPTHLNNLIAACAPCNLKKGNMSYSEFVTLVESEHPGLMEQLASGAITVFIFGAAVVGTLLTAKILYNLGKKAYETGKSFFENQSDQYY